MDTNTTKSTMRVCNYPLFDGKSSKIGYFDGAGAMSYEHMNKIDYNHKFEKIIPSDSFADRESEMNFYRMLIAPFILPMQIPIPVFVIRANKFGAGKTRLAGQTQRVCSDKARIYPLVDSDVINAHECGEYGFTIFDNIKIHENTITYTYEVKGVSDLIIITSNKTEDNIQRGDKVCIININMLSEDKLLMVERYRVMSIIHSLLNRWAMNGNPVKDYTDKNTSDFNKITNGILRQVFIPD